MKTEDYSQSEIASMTLIEAETAVVNAVYEATALIEQLQYAGKVSGNGHHARQHVAQCAVEELRKRWVSSKLK